MRNSVRLGAVIALAASGFGVPALAYYDDVHYGLTYFIARQTGFTHWQAYRIASACSRIDWDERTEPVQVNQQLADAFIPIGGNVHTARMRFHAFRYDGDGSQVIHQEKDGAAAYANMVAELKAFYERAIRLHRNPGAYLHALQDVIPHFGYGSQWGHNPGDYAVFARVLAQRLPIGSSTDWVSFRPPDVRALCATTNEHLKPFMQVISPYQVPRTYGAAECASVVAALAQTNPHPAPFTSDEERLRFMYVAMSDRKLPIGIIMAGMGGEEQLRRVTAALRNPEVALKMNQHLHGPQVERGYDVIDRALEADGFPERLPRHEIKYDLSGEGGPVNPAQLDDWVLTGSARLSISGYQGVTARLLMDVRDAAGVMKRTPLRIEPVAIRANSEYTWESLPIGDIYAELTRAQGEPIVVPMALNKRVKTFGPVPVGGQPPPSPTPLPVPTPEAPKPVNTGNFTGDWDSWIAAPFRIPIMLSLSQSGAEVNGSYKMEGRYTQDGKGVAGTIKGTVKVDTLTYTWDDGKAKGTGTFRLVKDGAELRGRFGVGEAYPNRLWDAVRK